ncbi:immunity 53 family protein [Cohnella soli]|uniref:Immunity 53 family protein n=1 Tax=Cohnella soli TaxID=425005 RepID=A0ABW0HL27_9BACL
MNVVLWLEDWFNGNCNDDWEHGYGIQIVTLDNPGWSVDISLVDTDIEHESFSAMEIERSDENWLHCFIEDGIFKGRGGPKNLGEILNIFRDWVTNLKSE